MQTQAQRTRQSYVQFSISRRVIPRDEAAVFEADEHRRKEERIFNEILEEPFEVPTT